jgi:hypothetical protein
MFRRQTLRQCGVHKRAFRKLDNPQVTHHFCCARFTCYGSNYFGRYFPIHRLTHGGNHGVGVNGREDRQRVGHVIGECNGARLGVVNLRSQLHRGKI